MHVARQRWTRRTWPHLLLPSAGGAWTHNDANYFGAFYVTYNDGATPFGTLVHITHAIGHCLTLTNMQWDVCTGHNY